MKKKLYHSLLYFLLIHLHSIFLFAQEKDSVKTLEEVIIKGELEIPNHGLKITKIDSTILKQHLQGNLGDLLASNSSIFIKSYGRGALATASFRGTSSSHTKLVWNGMDVTSPMLGQVDFSLIPIALVEEINLASGGASLSNTSGGLGGAILLNNKPSMQKHFKTSYLQGFGSFGTHTESLNLSFSNAKIQSKTKLFYQYSDNNFKYYQRDINRNKVWKVQNNAEYTQYGFTQDIYAKLKNNQLISFNIWGQKAERAIPKLSSNEGREDINEQLDESIRAMLSYEYFLNNKQFTFQTGYSIKNLDYYLAKSLPFDNQYFISVNTHSKEKTWFYKTVFQSNFKNIGGLLTNLQMQHHKVENVELINNIGFQKSRWELVYMFDIYANITKNLKVNLISRQEYIDWNLISQSPNSVDNKSSLKTIRDYILPKMFVFSVFYRPIHYLNWDIKSSFTRNYRYPTLNDLYFQVGGNPNLKPEKGYTYEIGSTFEKSISNWNFTTQLTAYYSWIDDWILWRPQTKGNWTPMNVQFVEARGVEIEYKINYKSNKFKYNISANYAYLKTTAEKNYSSNNQFILGRQLPYIPQHSADFSFKIDYKKWSIQYLFQFNSKRYATLQNSVYYLSTLPNYFMSDILIERKMNYKKLEFTIQGKVLNLLNENYRTVLGRNMPMRHYECWLNIQF